MKNQLTRLSSLALIAATISISCNSSQKPKDETPMSNTDTTTISMATDTITKARQDWEKFKSDAKEKVRQNDDSITAFKQRVDKVGKKMQVKFDKRIDKMKERNEELKARLDNFKEEGKEKWEKFKYDFNNDMDTLNMKWKELIKKDKNS